MLDYITKDMYFTWIEQYASKRAEYKSTSVNYLKDIQDHYAISRLSRASGLRVLEVGGGTCRVMSEFSGPHECWNAEKFDGKGLGPKKQIRIPGIRNASVYLGEFSQDLPEDYFDIVFSISVVEHVENSGLAAFFQDIARVLKPDDLTFHAIDVYVFDSDRVGKPETKYFEDRLHCYHRVPELTKGALQFVHPPAVASRLPQFSCAYASNSDRGMLAWNRIAPTLKPIRSIAQSVSLMAEWTKVAERGLPHSAG